MSRFKKGQKLVCVDDQNFQFPTSKYSSIVEVEKNKVYTFRAYDDEETGGILLEEIRNLLRFMPSGVVKEVPFKGHRFVPIESTFKRITFQKVIELAETSMS